jgi:putative aldouronate transport system permease protein
MFLVSLPRLQTLQYRLYQLLQQSEMIARELTRAGGGQTQLLNAARRMQITPMAVRMATTFFVTLPILLVYPFLQRYFVKGLLIGAIKA